MAIHQSWKAHVQGFVGLFCGIVLLLAPWLLSLVGREFALGNWIGYVGRPQLRLNAFVEIVLERIARRGGCAL